MRIGAIIMASGRSVRLGKEVNKLFLTYKGKSFIQICTDNVLQAGFHEVVVVTAYPDALRPILTMLKPFRLVTNNHPELGISESIRLGLLHALPCDAYMFFPVDQPQLQVETINQLKTFAQPDRIVVPLYHKKQGSPVIFGSDFKAALLLISGDVGGRQILRQYAEYVTYVEVEDASGGLDIDTMEAYITLKKSEGL